MQHEKSAQRSLLSLIVLFLPLLIQAQFGDQKKRIYDPPYNRYSNDSDPYSASSIKLTQLYSRTSGKHLRILQSRRIDAKGLDGDRYAKLFFESDGFGRVRIKGAESNLYVCVHRRNKRLDAQKKGRGNKKCVWKEIFAPNGYTELRSAWHRDVFLAFNKKGNQKRYRRRKKLLPGMKQVQFLHRPWTFRHYRGKYRLVDKKLEKAKYVTNEQWRKWKMSLM